MKKIGIALGSGGARGWAHVGVLQYLNQLGIRPYCVAGTSVGAIVGAVYSAGNLDDLVKLSQEMNWQQVAKLFLEIHWPSTGLISGKRILQFLQRLIPQTEIDELPIPFAAVATVLEEERELVISKGNLLDAIRASISIPGIFTPPDYQESHLVDGGFANPLPTSVCRKLGADVVVGVDINLRYGESSEADEKKNFSIFEILTRTMRIAENKITQRDLERFPPDILIQPAVGHISTLDFHRGEDGIRLGIEAAATHRVELERLVEDGGNV
ncbi:MAG: patatin-like phospholipase family protein [Kiritimatiellae bacterium]|nr:patatin-like phospholipase family protein [Kiritimatiellia bacterium]